MNIFALYGLLVFCVASLIGCSAVKPEQKSMPAEAKSDSTNSIHVYLSGLVIFPETCSNVSSHVGQDTLPLWSPSTNLVIEVLNQIPEYLQHANKDPLVRPAYYKQLVPAKERLPKSICQVAGITFQGRKGILLNFLPAEEANAHSDWRKQFINVYDGGPRWWSVVYLEEEKKFKALHFDLGY
jgi:hypothetical protein